MVAEIARGHPVGQVLKESLVGPPNRAEAVLAHSFSFTQMLIRAVEYFVLNFPTPLAILAPVGLWMACKRAELRGLVLFAFGVFIVGFVFAFRYLVPDQFVFYYPCYVLFALFAALGIAAVARTRPAQWTCVALAVLPALVYEVAPSLARQRGISLGLKREIPYRDSFAYFLRPRKNGDIGAERFARAALQTASPDGLLIGDSTVQNAVAYVRDVQGVHPDVTLSFESDVASAPPTIGVTPENIRPFVARGHAYAYTNAAGYLPKWLSASYDLVPVGVAYRIVEKGAGGRKP
jgi:hypothetical protein